MALLSVRKLHKKYGGVTAIGSLDLDLAKGEVIVLLGPSGCGKSTLLRCINGLEEHQGGSIEMEGAGVFGKDISWQTARQKVGMVFQSYELFAHMTVIDNILLGPLKVQKRNRAEAEAQADKLLARVGLLERKNAYPRELSGGQKQRLALATAFLSRRKSVGRGIQRGHYKDTIADFCIKRLQSICFSMNKKGAARRIRSLKTFYILKNNFSSF